MDSYSDGLMEDLIDYNIEDSASLSRTCWTEQALDLFISILKNVNRISYPTQTEMLEVITRKMSERGYNFSLEQIERKYNSLKKMYTEKKERNQIVEPELAKLFGNIRAISPTRRVSPPEPPQKKLKLENNTDDSMLHIIEDDSEEKKILWSPEATKIFLGLLEEMRPQLGTKLRTKKQMWEEICKRLKAHGHAFTYPQVENKWKALLRHYRNRLELIRNGVSVRSGGIAKLTYYCSAWPEIFDSASQKGSSEVEISFANDQRLPYEDDGYEDEEPYRLEEASQLPEIEVIADEVDPVLIEDPPPPSDRKDQGSTRKEPLQREDSLTQLDKLIKEIANFREDNQKYQNELLLIKRMKLSAYRERTAQFTRIADELSGFMNYLKRKSSNTNL